MRPGPHDASVQSVKQTEPANGRPSTAQTSPGAQEPLPSHLREAQTPAWQDGGPFELSPTKARGQFDEVTHGFTSRSTHRLSTQESVPGQLPSSAHPTKSAKQPATTAATNERRAAAVAMRGARMLMARRPRRRPRSVPPSIAEKERAASRRALPALRRARRSTRSRGCRAQPTRLRDHRRRT